MNDSGVQVSKMPLICFDKDYSYFRIVNELMHSLTRENALIKQVV